MKPAFPAIDHRSARPRGEPDPGGRVARAGRFAAMAMALAAGSAACRSGPDWRHPPHDTYFSSAPAPRLHAPIEGEWNSEVTYLLEGSLVRPLGDAISPGQYLAPTPALDINDFGHVLDSTWFTNRITRRPMTPTEIRTGPNSLNGPAPGPLTVVSGKVEGVTPGFEVEDSAGNRFVVKLDHPAYPALSSGAEIIATKILYAAGYNVPENYVVRFDLGRLQLAKDATTVGAFGAGVPLTQEGLDDILSNANPFPDGTIRALFSRVIPGRIIGPFDYEGVRAEDPNDRVPHERRRSLRGLRYIYAWLNNTDPRASNSLDTFVSVPEDPDLGHVEHYLLDFGDALGASGTEPKYRAEGYEYEVDLEALAVGLFSFGIHYRYWLPVRRSPMRSVGTFEARVFDPRRWRPAVPNPAFQHCDDDDLYWAASLISRFTPELLGAAADTAEYTEPGARDHVLTVLLQRQAKILELAFSKFLPLEDLIVRGWKVGLTDRAVVADLYERDEVRYHWSIRDLGGGELTSGVHEAPWADLEPALRSARQSRQFERAPFLIVEWIREDLWGERSPPFRLVVRADRDRPLPVAFERARG